MCEVLDSGSLAKVSGIEATLCVAMMSSSEYCQILLLYPSWDIHPAALQIYLSISGLRLMRG